MKFDPNEMTFNLEPMGRLCKNNFKASTASFIGYPLIEPLLSIRNIYSYIFGAISRLNSSSAPWLIVSSSYFT